MSLQRARSFPVSCELLILVRFLSEILEKKFRPKKADKFGAVCSSVQNILCGTGIAADLDRNPIFRDRGFVALLERGLVFRELALPPTDQVT